MRRTFLFFFFLTTQTELSPALSTANMIASASAVVMCKLSIPGQPWQPQTKPHLPSAERSVPLQWVWTFAVLNDCSDRPNIYIPQRLFAGVFGTGITSFLSTTSTDQPVKCRMLWLRKDLHKEGDASVGHSVGQTQDAAAHDGVAQVEDWHAKGGIALVLWKHYRLGNMIQEGKSVDVNNRRGPYIFRLILLLAQVVFREEVLTLSIDVGVRALEGRRVRQMSRSHCSSTQLIPF